MNLTNEFIEELNNYSQKKFKKKFKFLGEGIARKVYALDDKYVVKVAKNDDGYHQNFVERYIYASSPPELKRYLCPIYYSNDKIIIMAKATPYNKITGRHSFVNPSQFREEPTIKTDLNSLIYKYHLYTDDIYAARSWGVIDGKYYLIDFGCTSELGDRFYDGVKALYYMNQNPVNLLKKVY